MSFWFFSALLILIFSSPLALARAFSAFLAAGEIFVFPLPNASACLIFSLALIFINFSSSIGGLVKCSGNCFLNNDLGWNDAFVLSKASDFGDLCVDFLSTFWGEGWITANVGWEYFGIYLKLSNSLAFSTNTSFWLILILPLAFYIDASISMVSGASILVPCKAKPTFFFVTGLTAVYGLLLISIVLSYEIKFIIVTMIIWI